MFEADRTSVAREGLEIIRDLYEVERRMTPGPTPHPDRCRTRKWSRLRVLDFVAWADGVLAQVSARTPLAAALRYAVKLKPALLAYTTDGRLEIDNNPAENALRAVALGRRNWTFGGADCGGERAAAMYTLLETCRLNAVNPQEWLADVLERIGQGHPVNRLDELLPWTWATARGGTQPS